MIDKNEIDIFLARFSSSSRNKLRDIIVFSNTYLIDEYEKGSENGSLHGFKIARILKETSLDVSLLSVALLYDLLIQKNGKDLLKISPLNQKEKKLVIQLSKFNSLNFEKSKKNLNEFLDLIAEESSILSIKIADRLNDLRNIKQFSLNQRKKIASESLHIYAAIAGRLGIYNWRYEMEDICFKILYKNKAITLQKKFDNYAKLDNLCIEKTKEFLKKKFKYRTINIKLESRIKPLYSTYRKMILKKRKFSELTDRLAIRIITLKIEDCYKALHIVHKYFHQIPGKLKDYIGSPKENGYQSIHTVVYPLPGITELPIEIQIRTREMDKVCKYGIASHERYKNNKYILKSNYTKIDLIKSFQFLNIKEVNLSDFEDTLRKYYDKNKMAIFDSNNNLYYVNKKSNVIDFICVVYPKRISYIKQVHINGRVVSIDMKLKDGDVIEIKFGREKTINHNWIKACNSKISKEKINKTLNKIKI